MCRDAVGGPDAHLRKRHAPRSSNPISRSKLSPFRRPLLPIALLVLHSGCGPGGQGIQPVYDKETGRLQLLKYDANRNGIVDTWSHMNGTRVLKVEIDANEDGKLDRWEYYDAEENLQKVGMSRADDGLEDAWFYATSGGTLSRVEVSMRRNGTVDRTEYYVRDALVRAEEDGDGDGKIDKWETYEAGRLAAVAFDSTRRGTPDRRLTYAADGSATLEVDPAGNGRFVRVNPSPR